MKLVERPEPQAAINDVVVEVHASGFVPTELAWPSTSRDCFPFFRLEELDALTAAYNW